MNLTKLNEGSKMFTEMLDAKNIFILQTKINQV